MNIENAKELTYSKIRSLYKTYLQSNELGRNSVDTTVGDSFYLWNNESKEEFWRVLSADNFEQEAHNALLKALRAHSSGKAEKLVDNYVSALKRFRTFILSDNATFAPEKDDMTALKDFLLDIDCLTPLYEWTSKFNLFDILKITRTEIRHSNMLSWLMDPSENHGLGDSVLKGFIQYVTTNFDNSVDVFHTLLMDCHDFIILREWHNIDILAVSSADKLYLCIENKIDSKEHDNQLDKYKKILEEYYPDYAGLYVYLSPEGTVSSDPDNWCSMSYQDVLNIVESSRKKVKLLPEAEFLIQNYVDTIRRDIVGDEKLAKICADIYAKHQKALDLIFENRPDRASDLSAILMSWAKSKTEEGLMEVVPDKCVKSYTRFKTKGMSAILPDSDNSLSGWGTPNYYFYEIRNNEGNECFIQLSLSSKNIPDNLRAICEKINALYPSKQKKENWQWKTVKVSKHVSVDEDMSEDKIFEQLDKRLKEMLEFEEKLTKQLAD